MNILVIGGAGYIGSMLVPNLLDEGHSVHVLDILRYKQKALLQLCHNKRFDITIGDFRDTELVKSMVPKYDVVIILLFMPLSTLPPKSSFLQPRQRRREEEGLLSSVDAPVKPNFFFPCLS